MSRSLKETRRAWALSNPDRIRAASQKWKKANKDKIRKYRMKPHVQLGIKAGAEVHNATRSGKLIKPTKCSRCKKRTRIMAHHHKGYDPKHWLDVEWLCSTCHGIEHSLKHKR